jgi:SRSO17 transposase
MSGLPRSNGWTIAGHVGDRAPDKTQRLLNRACWDSAAAMAVVRGFVVAGLDQATRGRRGLAVGAVDETGQVKQGVQTAGVKRHYMGCAGKASAVCRNVLTAPRMAARGSVIWRSSTALPEPGSRYGISCGQ